MYVLTDNKSFKQQQSVSLAPGGPPIFFVLCNFRTLRRLWLSAYLPVFRPIHTGDITIQTPTDALAKTLNVLK